MQSHYRTPHNWNYINGITFAAKIPLILIYLRCIDRRESCIVADVSALTTDVEAEIGSAAGVDVAAGVLLLFI